jgi:hypothetical protein
MRSFAAAAAAMLLLSACASESRIVQTHDGAFIVTLKSDAIRDALTQCKEGHPHDGDFYWRPRLQVDDEASREFQANYVPGTYPRIELRISCQEMQTTK